MSGALDNLYHALEENATPAAARAVADWYEAAGNGAAAECLRWAAEQDKRPFLYRSGDSQLRLHNETWHDGWYWWATDRPPGDRDIGPPQTCRLTHRLWLSLRHGFHYPPVCFKEYRTAREAYEALIAAWPGADAD